MFKGCDSSLEVVSGAVRTKVACWESWEYLLGFELLVYS